MPENDLLTPLFDMLRNHPEIWAILMFVASLLLMLAVGNPLIRWLKALPGMKWSAREDTPDTHLKKAGTPSMGGLGIIGSALASVLGFFAIYTVMNLRSTAGSIVPRATIAEMALQSLETILLLAVIAGFMWLGYADDRSKATGGGGLMARHKFAWQLVLTIAFLAIYAYITTAHKLFIDLAGDDKIWFLNGAINSFTGANVGGVHIGLLAITLVALLILLTGTCNAVNLTDGIDGLAAGSMAITGISLAVCNERPIYDPAWIGAALSGACFGFLAFNRYPARVFMGDTGSLALGAALGICAALSGAIFLLPFIGFIFYIEMFSVLIQVGYFRYTRKKTGEGKRLFRRAPLHHHFELGGWSEQRVVVTFCAVHLLMNLIGVVLWKNGYIPRWP